MGPEGLKEPFGRRHEGFYFPVIHGKFCESDAQPPSSPAEVSQVSPESHCRAGVSLCCVVIPCHCPARRLARARRSICESVLLFLPHLFLKFPNEFCVNLSSHLCSLLRKPDL